MPNIAEIRYDEKTLVNYITVTNELPLSLQLFHTMEEHWKLIDLV
ncbi:MAG: hypothetical protein WKG06_08685 [Segetibacter sp.]